MESAFQIQRHKTAIGRSGLSVPTACALRDGVLDSSRTFFDYGCGRGQDILLLGQMGIECEGWDPVHRPQAEPIPADVVNLGYVINVIEDSRERAEVLQRAWALCRDVLIVAAQLDVAAPDRSSKNVSDFADGILTTRGTFQKYYTQSELRAYLEQTLSLEAVPAAPGVFYLFREETARQQFLVNRYRRQIPIPKRRISEVVFEQHKEILEPFLQSLARLGRLPGLEDLPEYPQIIERFGSAKRALAIVNRVTDAAAWSAVAARRSEDLLVYLALSRFGKRPSLPDLPQTVQSDIKAFFGTYRKACAQADALLFQIGDSSAIDAACRRCTAGRLVENALLLHQSALVDVEPLLRIYEGAARALAGEVDGTNVVKLHRHSGKVTYLVYSDFDTETHPALSLRVKVTLPTLAVDVFDHSGDSPASTLDDKAGLQLLDDSENAP